MNRKLFSLGSICFILLFFIAGFVYAQDPRPMVRIIYFLPKDRQPQPDINAKLDTHIKDVQQLFANQMEAHGFGRKTFQFETDAEGNAVVHHFIGEFTDAHYSNLPYTWDIWEEIDKQFDASKNIYLTVIDMSSEELDGGGIAGRGGSRGLYGGKALVTVSTYSTYTSVTAHELGHTFGLSHDYRSNAKRIWKYTTDWMLASFCTAEQLDVHPAFNPERQQKQGERTHFKMFPLSLASPPNVIRFRFEISNPNGINQVQLFTPAVGLIGCKYLNGNPHGIVEFVTPGLTPNNKSVQLAAIDVHGNVKWSQGFPIDITPLLPRSETISIPDPHLAAAVQRRIGNAMTTHTMLYLDGLNGTKSGITDLTGLEHAHNLRILYLDSNTVPDLQPLSGLTNLHRLRLGGNNISDISALSALTNLHELYLHHNNISDLSALSGLTNLYDLFLYANNISDVSALSALTNLNRLLLTNNNNISDISALSALTNLNTLTFTGSNISDISALSTLTNLNRLWLQSGNISDISALSALTNLNELWLGGNNISDISALSALTNLIELSLSGNNISDISALSELTNLIELGLHNNNISDISALSGLTNLTRLRLHNNNISDISPLLALNLTGTEWDSTGLSLQNNPLSYTAINTHIPAMQAKGIEIVYDQRTPTKLLKISGDAQQTVTNSELPFPFVVEVQDQRNRAFAEVPVTFSITEGRGKLSTLTTTTDTKGRAKVRLTLGQTEGETTIRATAAEISQPVQFTVKAILPTSFVQLPDTNLTAKIAETLGKPTDASMTAADMLTLTSLTANNTSISDLTGLQHASNLTTLTLDGNNLSTIDLLTGFTQLTTLSLDNNKLSNIVPLVELAQLETLSLENNNLSDIASLVELTELKTLRLRGNLLSYPSLYTTIPTLRASGVNVGVDARTPTTLINIPGTPGVAGEARQVLVQVEDQNGIAFAGVPVTFTLTAAGGHRSTSKATSNLNGKAITTLTLGPEPGENVVSATVTEIQQPLTFRITTIDENTLVPIPDVNLRAKIAETLNKPKNATLNAGDLSALTTLDARNANIQNLTGIEYAHNLNFLNLAAEFIEGKGVVNSNTVSDWQPLSGLTNLHTLELYNNNISDISALSGLTNLHTLYLHSNNISDISALSGLTNLHTLWLENNNISDISALSGLTNLYTLLLTSNNVSDISALSALNLTQLGLQDNNISDISALSGLTNLTLLWLQSNNISDISALSALNLTQLGLSSNNISDISALSGLTNLTSLWLQSNNISDISALSTLTNLNTLGLQSNNISDISALSGLTNLTSLWLQDNNISDISALSTLTSLTRLWLSNNIISDVSPVVGLNLTGTSWDNTGLNISANPLSYASINTHIPAMQARGIKVQFDVRTPTHLVKISGAGQQGITNTMLPLPFVVEVRDQRNKAFAGVPVTFTVATGGGKLSATSVPTDTAGRASAHLTMGQIPGTTTVRVMATEISQPVQFTATVVLLNAPVTVSDAALHAAITSALGKSPNSNLTVSDMLQLATLTVNSANIRELTGLEHASNLTTLSLNRNNLSDIAPLTGLSKLTTLSLNNNRISDVTPLAALAELQTLSLENNDLADATPLSGLTQLETLALDNNRLWNVSAFIGMSELRTLSLENNGLSDVAPLTSLRQLKTLELKGNLLSYPSLHTHIPALQVRGATVRFDPRTPTTLVNISGTHGVAGTAVPVIVEVQDAQGLGFSGVPVTFTVTAGGGQLNASNVIADSRGSARTTLTLGPVPGKNTIRAVAAEVLRPVSFSITAVDTNSRVIVRDTNLRTKIIETLGKPQGVQLTAGDMLGLTQLDARNANIQNLTGLEHAHNLTSLNLNGEYIEGEGTVNSNTISDFSPIAGLTRLTRLNLSLCGLSDASFVSGLTQLTELHLGRNTISDISPLANLIQLNQLSLWNNTISDVSPLANLKKLTYLFLNSNSISDISPLAKLTQLTDLLLGSNSISDVSPLANLKKLTYLFLDSNSISDISPLAKLTQLNRLWLWNNIISDVSPIVELNLTGTSWSSTGLEIRSNPLNYASINTHIPAMQAKGIAVKFDNRAHSVLVKISEDTREGEAHTTLVRPFVVEALDEHGATITGRSVTFRVSEGNGRLSVTNAITDAEGRAQTTLTLGPDPGVIKIRVTAAQITYPVIFTVIVTEATRLASDVNGDGVVNIQDLVLVSSNLGQTGENASDVNGDGVVNIQDLVRVAGVLGDGAAAAPSLHASDLEGLTVADIQEMLTQARQLALTDPAYLRGLAVLERLLARLLPKETALLPNYPNPFNPETWIPYQLAAPAEVTLRIYAIDGALVRTLSLGHKPIGMYQTRTHAAYWDGRNQIGEPVASGVYFYTLTAGDFTATRKMLIRK